MYDRKYSLLFFYFFGVSINLHQVNLNCLEQNLENISARYITVFKIGVYSKTIAPSSEVKKLTNQSNYFYVINNEYKIKMKHIRFLTKITQAVSSYLTAKINTINISKQFRMFKLFFSFNYQ